MFRHELENYAVEKEVGHGSFATVYKGRDLRNGNAVAIKAINSERLNKKLSENLATEISVMKEFKSEHIVELYDLQKTGKFIYLVMEYCDRGDLAGLLRKKVILEEALVLGLIKQLGSALKILFEANFAHRDLKPQNLLLCQSKNDNGHLILKLGDFGFARFVDPADMAETLCGSPLYMAPEILRYEKYDGKADLWSVGAIMYEMLFGRPPFKAQNHIQLLKVIENSQYITFPDTAYLSDTDPDHQVVISESCKDLLIGLLQKNPNDRLSFEKFITHPFFDEEGEEPSPLPSSEPIKLTKGFAVPRQKSQSLSNMSFKMIEKAERISQLSASLKQTPIKEPGTQSSTLCLKDDVLWQEEDRLKDLLSSFPDIRSGLVKLVLRDARLALILKDLADQNTSLLEKSTSSTIQLKNMALEAFKLLQMSIDLLQNILRHLKGSSQPELKPSDDNSRALVLWVYYKCKEMHDKLNIVQKQLEDLNSAQAIGLSIMQSSVISTGEAPSIASDILYHHALKLVHSCCLNSTPFS